MTIDKNVTSKYWNAEEKAPICECGHTAYDHLDFLYNCSICECIGANFSGFIRAMEER